MDEIQRDTNRDALPECGDEMKHAVYSGTRNLYEQMVWAAKSLVANSSVDVVHFLIEDDEFPYELPDFIKTHNVKDYAEKTFPESCVNRNTHFTKFALIRACYCELFPDVDYIVQLDVDTVCVDNVDELWQFDMDGLWFRAAEETLSGYNPYKADSYHNVGVCVFNLEQMRKDNAQEQLVSFINTVRCHCVEQDAMNYYGTMYQRIGDLPVRYNENRACGYTDNPAIQHYVGYMDWLTNPNLPRREYLKLYRDKSWNEILRMRNG